MNNITIAAELDYYQNKKGLKQIYIRITQAQKHKRIKMGLAVLPRQWTGKYGSWISIKNKESSFYNNKILEKINEVQKAYLSLSEDTSAVINKEAVFKEANKVNHRIDLVKYWNSKVEQMDNYNQSKGYRTSLKKVIEFSETDQIEYRHLNFEWLCNFERFLKRKGLSTESVYGHLKRVRAIYNKGINEEVFELKYYPFRAYRMPRVPANHIERLDLAEIQSIFSLEYEPSNLVYWVLKGFELSFRCAGIRIEDLLTLKWSNLRFGRLVYNMKKGVTMGKEKSFEVSGELNELLNELRRNDAHNTGYILPFLKKGDESMSNEDYKRQIGRRTTLFNTYLKDIADDACVSKPLTSKISRHSWALYAYEQTNDIRFVQENLDHNNIKVTQGYLGRLDSGKNDQKLRQIEIKKLKKEVDAA
jgi:integrase